MTTTELNTKAETVWQYICQLNFDAQVEQLESIEWLKLYKQIINAIIATITVVYIAGYISGKVVMAAFQAIDRSIPVIVNFYSLSRERLQEAIEYGKLITQTFWPESQQELLPEEVKTNNAGQN